MKLKLIDCLAPFFLYDDRKIINWSKIPFFSLEKDGFLDKNKSIKITQACNKYFAKVSSYGYNAIAIDDLAHFVIPNYLSSDIKNKLQTYSGFYKKIINFAKNYKLDFYVLADIMFYSDDIVYFMKKNQRTELNVFEDYLKNLFLEFPEVKGIVLRFGETDGADVNDTFISKPYIKKPEQLNKFILKMLKICEKYKKYLICRTWSLGAYKIGDIMWNLNTYNKAFGNIHSRYFIISMKPGYNDFFRTTLFNDLFFKTTHKKIIELQARREYEGFGEFPAYIGNEYEKYADKIKSLSSVVGIYVWAQGGGWGPFRRLTFVRNSSLWNELNVYSIINIFQNHNTGESAVINFCKNQLPQIKPQNQNHFLRLIKLSDKVINQGYYYKDYLSNNYFVRRIKIPPLFIPWWNKVYINTPTKLWAKHNIKDPQDYIIKSKKSLYLIKQMENISKKIGLKADFNFQHDTFELLYYTRKLLIENYTKADLEQFNSKLKVYKKKYRYSYDFYIKEKKLTLVEKTALQFFPLIFRKSKTYRKRDRVILFSGISLIILGLVTIIIKRSKIYKKNIPHSLNTFFK